MFSNWLTKGGIVQLVAPDENFRVKEQEEAASGLVGGFLDDLFNIVAPDPNFSTVKQRTVIQSDDISKDSFKATTHDHVQCINCHRWTPIQLNYPISDSQFETPFFTPRRIQKPTMDSDFSNLPEDEILGRKVLSAAVDLARSISSPTATWEPIKNFFNLCASTTALTSKQLSKLGNQLQKDPSLIYARSSKMGNVAPDGFTPVHAAAYSGNIAVLELLISFKPEVVHILDVQGRTALHIASERGHLNAVTFLKQAMRTEDKVPIGGDAPVDLSGRTPLAWAATSSVALAVKNRSKLEHELFSPEDKSILGIFTPPSYRMGGDRVVSRKNSLPTDANTVHSDTIAITYGFSEMPGMRIEMEDAMCYHYPLQLKTGSIVAFFGVFDGHGDGGFASRFVADMIAECFIQDDTWNSIDHNNNTKDDVLVSQISAALGSACIKADEELRKQYSLGGATVTAGGSTGVMTVITADHVIVANVGDSRCILVQKQISENALDAAVEMLGQDLNDLSLKEETHIQTATDDSILVTALSTDHKPNLPIELQRITKAGYEVIPDSVRSDNDEGSDSLIWKIKKSDHDKIAVSRAFGDFDYKDKKELDAHKQAIICIPDITVHERMAARDLFLVLACDGVYDVMENIDIGKFIIRKFKAPILLPQVADCLLKECLERGSRDNMSVMIVQLSTQASVEETISAIGPKVLSFADE